MSQTIEITNEERAKEQLRIIRLALDKLEEGLVTDPVEETKLEIGDFILKTTQVPLDLDYLVVIPMRDFPELFKVIDKAKRNVATNFKTTDKAVLFIRIVQETKAFPDIKQPPITVCPEGFVWDAAQSKCVEKTVEPKPEPGTGQLDAQGVRMIYAPKQGGQIVTQETTVKKWSEHNTGTRTSLYSNTDITAVAGELTEGFLMDLSDNGEQNAPKLYSGGHTGSGESDETKQGRCYAIGINQDGTLHLAKEYPYHPETPKQYKNIQYVDASWKTFFGNIAGKKVWMKIIYHPHTRADGKKVCRLEWWFDKEGYTSQSLKNDWQFAAFAEDDGSWAGEPYFENNGVLFNGKILGFYIRIDTPKKPVDFFNTGFHELELPARKL